MGENEKQALQLSFNRFLRVAFQGSRVTSNGGLILVRELDERLGFGELIEQHLNFLCLPMVPFAKQHGQNELRCPSKTGHEFT